MEVFLLLQQSPAAFVAVCGVLGLLIGSFLNVVAYRLPIMMEREWRAQCLELLAEQDARATGTDSETQPVSDTNPPPKDATQPERFNIIVPGSRCPHCKQPVAFYDNIPVISFLLLRGKCRHCQAKIAWRYPIVEAMTGIFSAVVAWRFGFGWETAAGLGLTWALMALSLIDLDHQLLPDSITLPLVWVGLFLSLFHVYTSPSESIIGGMAGYLSLWSIYHLFRLITGKEGMGYGDFKLFAVFGTWLGWQCLPLIILFSSLVGAIVGIGLILFRGHGRNVPIPFGPYLAAAGWLYLIWGEPILHQYFRAFASA